MSKKQNTANVLAFERKLDPSDAIFYAGNWDDDDDPAGWVPVDIREKSVRGTKSHRITAKNPDPEKFNIEIQDANPQTVDVATLPLDADTLCVRFTLRVLGGAGIPSACNSAAYRTKLSNVVDAYVQQHGFSELANRYAANLANARFLWRNRLGAESVRVEVASLRNGVAERTWTFDALALNLRSIEAPDARLAELGDMIADGLAGRANVLLQVTARARIGRGQEVFPSQEMIINKEGSRKSKTLYQVRNIAAMHSQKIGNAIRTIDSWYEGAEELGPIAVEPYGSVTTRGEAYRQPVKKQDFYTLLDDWLLRDRVPPVEQQHFVMAVLIRGGVFGEAKKSQ